MLLIKDPIDLISNTSTSKTSVLNTLYTIIAQNKIPSISIYRQMKGF